MAKTSEVKTGLDAISDAIEQERANLKAIIERAKIEIVKSFNRLYAIPTLHADILTEIDGYTGTPPFYTDATPFEGSAKDEKARMTPEFIALRDAADAANVALMAFPEF